MVSQVPLVGILMIVNGSLATIMGVIYAIVGPMMFSIITRQQGGPPMPPQAGQIFQWVSIVYVVLGGLVALAGVINIAGGIAALRYRSRGLVITALFFNLLPIFTCYCLPTSLGLMIYGLIVMFQGDVAHAFSLGASGYSADEIRQRMNEENQYRRDDDRDDDDRRGRRRQRPREEETPEPPKPDRLSPPRGDAGDDRFTEK